ncbi:hypothetical protein BSZ39_09815 [Bowdeniella nasicola]|uniref:Uncharacterized protein n=1 Tax=Bowdeniella nasicola TaxID=208480 RepID=A0A1Q5Q0H5_9ACTO|nr:hypothetical protein BSZ39_09815 [Bowdeniella nasicola]
MLFDELRKIDGTVTVAITHEDDEDDEQRPVGEMVRVYPRNISTLLIRVGVSWKDGNFPSPTRRLKENAWHE